MITNSIDLKMPGVSLVVEEGSPTERYPEGRIVLRTIHQAGADDVNLTAEEAVLAATALLESAARYLRTREFLRSRT